MENSMVEKSIELSGIQKTKRRRRKRRKRKKGDEEEKGEEADIEEESIT